MILFTACSSQCLLLLNTEIHNRISYLSLCARLCDSFLSFYSFLLCALISQSLQTSSIKHVFGLNHEHVQSEDSASSAEWKLSRSESDWWDVTHFVGQTWSLLMHREFLWGGKQTKETREWQFQEPLLWFVHVLSLLSYFVSQTFSLAASAADQSSSFSVKSAQFSPLPVGRKSEP